MGAFATSAAEAGGWVHLRPQQRLQNLSRRRGVAQLLGRGGT